MHKEGLAFDNKFRSKYVMTGEMQPTKKSAIECGGSCERTNVAQLKKPTRRDLPKCARSPCLFLSESFARALQLFKLHGKVYLFLITLYILSHAPVSKKASCTSRRPGVTPERRQGLRNDIARSLQLIPIVLTCRSQDPSSFPLVRMKSQVGFPDQVAVFCS